jgi:copper homeostasis protein
MIIEVVAQSPDDAVIAARSGADRLELVSALSLGGLTPSLGSLIKCLHEGLPIVAMLRPRSGGFAYSQSEFEVMIFDGYSFLNAGAQGLVFGILTPGGEIDRKANGRLITELGGEAVFHRAFDALPDPFEAMEILIDLGFKRILTSGGRGTALEGAETLRRLHEKADGRIEILPGGGVRPENATEIVARTGIQQLHLAGQEWVHDSSTEGLGMVFNGPQHPEDRFGRVDGRIVAAMRAIG